MSNDLSSSTSSLLEWTVWRPLIPISNDGKPLATNITDLFFDFPYDRLPQPQGSSSSSTSSTTAAATTALLNLLLRPEISLTLCLMYYVSKPILKTWIGGTHHPPSSSSSSSSSSSVFTSAVAFHNFVLALFSAVCCWNSWPIVVQYWYRHGWEAVYCDQTGALWNDSGLGGWIIIFYWSKYYEFVDTWVLICKVPNDYNYDDVVICMYVYVYVLYFNFNFLVLYCVLFFFLYFGGRVKNHPSYRYIITSVLYYLCGVVLLVRVHGYWLYCYWIAGSIHWCIRTFLWKHCIQNYTSRMQNI